MGTGYGDREFGLASKILSTHVRTNIKGTITLILWREYFKYESLGARGEYLSYCVNISQYLILTV